MDTISVILSPEWLTAIGTIGAVFVALFHKPFVSWFNRPKIKMEYEAKTPCLDVVEEASTSSNKDKRIVIRVRLRNEGAYTADYSVVNVDEYYEKRVKGSAYVKKAFTPKLIKDCNGAKLSTVAPHLSYYLDVAAIQKFKGMSSFDEKGVSKQFYKLYLLGDGKTQQLGRGTFILPIKFYSSRTNMKIAYMQISWESDEFSIEKEHFEVKLLTEKQFDNLEKAE